MIRTIAAALAAFALVSFSARAEDNAAKADATTTTTKTDSAGNTSKTEKKSHKKAKKSAKSAHEKMDTDSAAKPESK